MMRAIEPSAFWLLAFTALTLGLGGSGMVELAGNCVAAGASEWSGMATGEAGAAVGATGIGAGGLPIGVMFAAKLGDEATLFRLAGQLEQVRPWFGKMAVL